MRDAITYKNIDIFSECYIALREKEGRIYTDEEVKKLPSINASHPHYKEWVIRKRSAAKLLRYLKRKRSALDFLEVGCGNGWLANHLSAIRKGNVTGLDINSVELEQAKRVFGKIPDLYFINGDLRSSVLTDMNFDVIVFAASIQYFPSLKEILNVAMQHLTLQGEIHIIDTRFYQRGEIPLAKHQTSEYYNSLGFPEMAYHYFHHCINDLENFQHKMLYNPSSLLNKFSLIKNPFPWIVIKNR